jgi:endo-1,4-beta-xylanase
VDPSHLPGEGDACPWDANLVQKPAIYGAIVSALGGTASATTAAGGEGTAQHWGQCGGRGELVGADGVC